MPFCTHCGRTIPDDVKYCANCGTPVDSEKQTERKTVYEGELHKCPSCGEILNAYVAICPSCGYEVRGARAVSSVKELAQKLEDIEAKRERKPSRPLRNRMYGEEITKTDEQKISLIRSFAIPNTKEDLYEFLILAGSNIDVDLYDGSVLKTDARLAVSDAWKAKFEQAYQKACLVFVGDPRLGQIQELYNKTHKSLNKAKGKLWKINGIIWGGLIAFLVILWCVIIPVSQNSESKRLDEIVSKIEVALENGEYKLALMYADSLIPQGSSDDGFDREWNIQREYWIDKVIDVAAQNGVFLERPTTPEETDPLTIRDLGSDNQEEIQQNIDEFNAQMDGIKEQWDSIWNGSNTDTDDTASSGRFDNVPYSVTNVKGFSFCIPDYWLEEGSKNEYLQYYAEQGDKVVMLSIAYPEESDDDYEVTFDGLYADNDNMIEAVAAMFTDGDVVDYEVFESDYGVKGILYHFTYSQKINLLKTTDGSGYYFCFPSEDDRRWFYVVLMYTDNVLSQEYKDDYMDLIATIKKKS